MSRNRAVRSACLAEPDSGQVPQFLLGPARAGPVRDTGEVARRAYLSPAVPLGGRGRAGPTRGTRSTAAGSAGPDSSRDGGRLTGHRWTAGDRRDRDPVRGGDPHRTGLGYLSGSGLGPAMPVRFEASAQELTCHRGLRDPPSFVFVLDGDDDFRPGAGLELPEHSIWVGCRTGSTAIRWANNARQLIGDPHATRLPESP